MGKDKDSAAIMTQGYIERRQPNNHRREREQQLRLALDSAEMGTWDWDIMTDEIRWDQRQFELFGLPPENFTGCGSQALEIIHPDDRGRVKEAISHALVHGDAFRTEFRVTHPDGSVHWLAGRGQMLPDSEDGTLRMIGVNFDITEYKQAEGEREKYIHLENLAQMHRLHMAGEIAALLAHQLNQPLAAIRSFAEAGLARLRRAEHNPERMQKTLEEVVAQSERAAGSIRELRGFLARQPQERSEADFNATVRSACLLMSVLARDRGITIKLDLAKSLPKVQMRTSQIEQVIVNLVENAIAAIQLEGEARGTIRVHTEFEQVRGEILAVVQDSGPGLSPEAAIRVFEPLYTTKKNGIGMGLVISRSIIEDHGGRIWAEPGKGGRFLFTLPMSQ